MQYEAGWIHAFMQTLPNDATAEIETQTQAWIFCLVGQFLDKACVMIV